MKLSTPLSLWWYCSNAPKRNAENCGLLENIISFWKKEFLRWWSSYMNTISRNWFRKCSSASCFTRFVIQSFPHLFGGRKIYCFLPGAIIRHGDHKHAPFLVLGLSLLIIWDNFFYFQSKLRHRLRTCACMLLGLLGMSHREMASQIPENFLCFWPTTQPFYVC